jgi:hypothetical protein
MQRWSPSLATLALIVAWFALGTEVEASSASKGKSIRAALGEHHCACGMACRPGKCCCAPDEAEEPPVPTRRPSKPVRAAIELGVNPCCVTSAPCDGGALPPSSGPLVRFYEPADRTAFTGFPPAFLGVLLAPPASDHAESPDGSRVDEPPERLADV